MVVTFIEVGFRCRDCGRLGVFKLLIQQMYHNSKVNSVTKIMNDSNDRVSGLERVVGASERLRHFGLTR